MKDKKILELIAQEEKRQKQGIELIPSENYASTAVRNCLSSVLTNKYSEGYPKKRYYGGNDVVDDVEILAQERAKKLFGVPFVNVQPYSGSPANLAVVMALLKPGETLMGQALVAGGHLTHGHKVSATGIFFKSVQYGLKKTTNVIANDSEVISSHLKQLTRLPRRPDTAVGTPRNDSLVADLFDYNEIRKLAKECRPKMIWVGTTAYPLQLHYEKWAKIADEVDAYLVADMAHIAGLVAGGAHPSPVPHVHVVTTTTHKTLRGPRGAMIMVTDKGLKKNPELFDKINKAVFPGLQGGPHDNQTAAIATALYEASQPEFKKYAHQIVKNAKILAAELKSGGLTLVGNGTETHLILVDLSKSHEPGMGVFAEKALDLAGLTLNKNTVPDEPVSPFYPSGIRLGTPAATTRGMKEKDMKFIGRVMIEVLNLIKPYSLPQDKEKRGEYIKSFVNEMKENKSIKKLHTEVINLVIKFPIP